MLGESAVGKSSIMQRYVKDTFDEYMEPTRGAAYQEKTLISHDHTRDLKLAIWDTAGQEIYKSLTPFYYKDADAVALVYDITSMKSFQALPYWLDEVRRHSPANCLISIVGNKSDCIEREQVSPAEAKSFAAQHNANFILVSAKEDSCIREMFLDFAVRRFPEVKAEFATGQEVKGVINADIVLPPAKPNSGQKLSQKPKPPRRCC